MVTIATMLIGYLPSVIQVKNAFKTWLLDTYMPGGINQQVFVYLDKFSSQAKDLTFVGLAGLIITTIMTLAVIEGAFNQIFKVNKSRPLYKKIAIYSAATILGPILLGIGSTLKVGSAQYLCNTAFYKTVYGAFAIFPLGLTWIYMTWLDYLDRRSPCGESSRNPQWLH
jgi:YihY family inner membrane protein